MASFSQILLTSLPEILIGWRVSTCRVQRIFMHNSCLRSVYRMISSEYIEWHSIQSLCRNVCMLEWSSSSHDGILENLGIIRSASIIHLTDHTELERAYITVLVSETSQPYFEGGQNLLIWDTTQLTKAIISWQRAV